VKFGWRTTCPHCGSDQLHLSKRRSVFERFFLNAVHVAPYRCTDCYERHFRIRLAKDWKPHARLTAPMKEPSVPGTTRQPQS
jgi:C4-type Zn-finger protein